MQVLEIHAASGVDTEFPYRVHIVDRGLIATTLFAATVSDSQRSGDKRARKDSGSTIENLPKIIPSAPPEKGPKTVSHTETRSKMIFASSKQQRLKNLEISVMSKPQALRTLPPAREPRDGPTRNYRKKYPPPRNSGLPEFTLKIPRKYRKNTPKIPKMTVLGIFSGIFGDIFLGFQMSVHELFAGAFRNKSSMCIVLVF